MHDCEEAALLERFGIGSYGYHELVDRAALLLDMCDHFMSHPSACLYGDIYGAVDKTTQHIHELYQLIALKEYEEKE